MGKHRGEALIVILHRDIGQQFAHAVHERLNAAHILGRCVVHLFWQANNDAFNRFTLYIVENKIDKRGGRNGCEATGNELQFIGHCKAGTFLAIINSQYSCHECIIFVSAFFGSRNHILSQPQSRAMGADMRT